MKPLNAISCIPAIKILLASLPLLPLAPAALHAQLVPDGGTTNITTAINLPGNLTVGTNGGNTIVNIIGPGGAVSNFLSTIGLNASSSSNKVTVQNSGAFWRNTSDLLVGDSGNGNVLIVSNGAVVVANRLFAGRSGSGNRLIVSAGTVIVTNGSFFGVFNTSSNNQAVVTGAGSLWTNASFLTIGSEGNGSQLVVSNGATVTATTLSVGIVSDSFNNRVTVDGGTLRASSGYQLSRGTNVFNAGLIESGALSLTTSAAVFEFNGGTLTATSSSVNNGLPFLVGNGVSAATNQLLGNGLHSFSQGLILTNNARLTGNGTILGTLTVATGGTVAPGNSIGQLVLGSSPVLNGTLLMEISKPDAFTLTNDQIQVSAPLTYGGALTVTNLGPSALAAGDVASLFNAASYDGAFTSFSLPALATGLMWTNRLLVDGSLAVVTLTPPSLSGVTRSGTNLLFNVTGGSPGGAFTVLTSTNVTLPRTSWTTNRTGNFDWLGNATVTNAISPVTPQRYFIVRAP
jgi:T5SS/PEP-CTERM-associated repeat protein